MKQQKESSESSKKNTVAFFVSSNVHKFFEAKDVLSQYRIGIAKLKVNVVEIQDSSIINIAIFSVLDAVKNSGLPVFVEDAGLFIEELGGFPGPYSKYVFKTIGLDGILKLMKGIKNRKAYFISVIAFSSPEESSKYFIGKVRGKISINTRGDLGFGYDPIFEPLQGNGRSFGEMTTFQKNQFSHRARSLREFGKWFSSKNKRRF